MAEPPEARERPLPFGPGRGRAKPIDRARHAHGHRERLRERLFAAGPEALHDHELLEAALFLTFPRGDTKPLAKDLLAQFGSLAGVLAATPAELLGVKGIGENAAAGIKIIHAMAVRALRREAMRGPVFSGTDGVLDYLHLDKAGLKVEHFRVLFLSTKNRLIRDEVMWEGTVNQAPAFPREIVKRALDLGAAGMILVHNHPSGDPTPSRDDAQLTRAIVDAAKPMGIIVHDHLVIARQGHASLRAEGLM